jgi:hypothetical protein
LKKIQAVVRQTQALVYRMAVLLEKKVQCKLSKKYE